jgi:hypothetical protein
VDLTTAGGRRAHRSSRSGPLRAWRLAAEAREARGRRGEPYRLHGRAAAGRRWADDGEERTAAAALGGGALRCGGGGGRGGEGCGIAVGWRWPFIGSGGAGERTGGVRPVEAGPAAIDGVGSSGGGNGERKRGSRGGGGAAAPFRGEEGTREASRCGGARRGGGDAAGVAAGAVEKKELTCGVHMSAREERDGGTDGRRVSNKKTYFREYANDARAERLGPACGLGCGTVGQAAWAGREGGDGPRLGWKTKERRPGRICFSG